MPEREPSLKPDTSGAVVRTEGPSADHQAVAPTTPGTVIVGTTPVDQSHMGALLQERADTRSLSVVPFAVAAFQDAQADLRRLGDRFDRERERADRLAEELAALRTENAVLKTQTKEITKRRRLKIWLFGLGGAVFGTGLGITVQSPTVSGSGLLLIAIGLVLLLLGSPRITGEE